MKKEWRGTDDKQIFELLKKTQSDYFDSRAAIHLLEDIPHSYIRQITQCSLPPPPQQRQRLCQLVWSGRGRPSTLSALNTQSRVKPNHSFFSFFPRSEQNTPLTLRVGVPSSSQVSHHLAGGQVTVEVLVGIKKTKVSWLVIVIRRRSPSGHGCGSPSAAGRYWTRPRWMAGTCWWLRKPTAPPACADLWRNKKEFNLYWSRHDM